MSTKTVFLKQRFMEAIISGDLGTRDGRGVVFTLREFKDYFSDIETDYINSFLPAATLEPGRVTMTHTKFLFRLRKGVYMVHPDTLADYVEWQS
jgi:hypothetical protein